MALGGGSVTTVLGDSEPMKSRRKREEEALPTERPEENLVDPQMDTRRRRPRPDNSGPRTVIY